LYPDGVWWTGENVQVFVSLSGVAEVQNALNMNPYVKFVFIFSEKSSQF